MKYTLSDKNSSDKIVEISAWCRKFCPSKNFVRLKFCPIFQYKSQTKIGQNFWNVRTILNLRLYTLWDNISWDKIFDTKPKFRQFCPIFGWLFYLNIGQNFRRTKFFVGQNFRHQVEIWQFCPTNFCPIRYAKFVSIAFKRSPKSYAYTYF